MFDVCYVPHAPISLRVMVAGWPCCSACEGGMNGNFLSLCVDCARTVAAASLAQQGESRAFTSALVMGRRGVSRSPLSHIRLRLLLYLHDE